MRDKFYAVIDTNARIEYFHRYVLKLKELPDGSGPGGDDPDLK